MHQRSVTINGNNEPKDRTRNQSQPTTSRTDTVHDQEFGG